MKISFPGRRLLPLLFLLAAPIFAQPTPDEATRACREEVETAYATREKARTGDARAQYALGLLFLDKLAEKAGDEAEEGGGGIAPTPDDDPSARKADDEENEEDEGAAPDEEKTGEDVGEPGSFADLKRAVALIGRGVFSTTPEAARMAPDYAWILQESVVAPMAKELGESPELPDLEADVTAQSEKGTLARAKAFLRDSGREEGFVLLSYMEEVAFDAGADARAGAASCPFSPLRFGKNDYEALYWFRRAAEQGLPEAQFALGNAILSGVGEDAWNSSAATRWFVKARAGGFAVAPTSEAGELLAQHDEMLTLQKAAEAGDGAAAYVLARIYNGDVGLMRSEERSRREQTAKWLRLAVAQDVPEARLWLARVYVGDDDVPGIPPRRAEGLEMLRRMAEADNPEAQKLLAGFAETAALRVEWLRRAAEHDLVKKSDLADAKARSNISFAFVVGSARNFAIAGAQSDLAEAYDDGKGVPRDEEKALFWMRRAARNDGGLGEHARGWLKEFEERAALARQAQGNDFAAWEAQYKLARAYLPYSDAPFRGSAIYLFPDAEKAAEIFRRFLAGPSDLQNLDETQKQQAEDLRTRAQTFVDAYERAAEDWRKLEQNAHAGDVEAQVELGERYQRARYSKGETTLFGRIVEDQEAAFQWFSRAAEAGDAEAQFRLGEWFLENRHDVKAARPWLEKAAARNYSAESLLRKWTAFEMAEKGDAAAQYALAYFYGSGDSLILGGAGVEKDMEKMIHWMRRAAEGGYPPAQYELGALHAWPRFGEMNLETSTRWLQKAAKAGHPLAQYFYGKARYLGRGAPADGKEGRRWLEAAARAGEMFGEGGDLKQVFDEETGQARPEFAWLGLGAAEQLTEDDPEAQTLMWLDRVNPYGAKMSEPFYGVIMAKTFLQNLDRRAALEKLAEKGDADAQFALGALFYREQLSPRLGKGFFCMGCQVDQYLPEEIAAFRARGVEWLRQAVKAGHWYARLALRRFEIGDPREEAEELAAARHVLCQRALLPDDECAPQGWGGQEEREQVMEEAFQELRQAARAGDKTAAFQLGEALREVYGMYFISSFREKAWLEEMRFWLREAANADIPGAARYLSEDYEEEGNTVEALFWRLKTLPDDARQQETEECDCHDEAR
ncbi:MAG: hypothetical protein LBD68_09015 [Zoogloeaceae bacterium]|jgi:TPR repeat protein|nr:hypothetical protein [Zoogloeaceae bacterium]